MVDAKAIYDNITDLIVACETVRRADRCGDCSLKEVCLIDSLYEEVAYKAKPNTIRKLIHLADDITEAEEEQNKTEEQRRWEAEAEEWNLRRCDPDYE